MNIFAVPGGVCANISLSPHHCIPGNMDSPKSPRSMQAMKTIGREILWNLPHAAAVIMYSLFGVVLLVIAWGVYRRVEAYRLGRTERGNRLDDLRGRLRETVRLAHGQRR